MNQPGAFVRPDGRSWMVRTGYSPSARLFEAAACGRPIITDRWQGIEAFFKPGEEILIADSPDQKLEHLLEMPKGGTRKNRQARAAGFSPSTRLHKERRSWKLTR